MDGGRGRVAVITGGTSGIGLAAGRALVARRVRVVLGARDRERGEAAVASLGSADDAVLVPTDVAEERDVQALVGMALERFGRLDYGVNAAGWSGHGPSALADTDTAVFEARGARW